MNNDNNHTFKHGDKVKISSEHLEETLECAPLGNTLVYELLEASELPYLTVKEVTKYIITVEESPRLVFCYHDLIPYEDKNKKTKTNLLSWINYDSNVTEK